MTSTVPDREAFIANVRAFADWLEANPSLPVPHSMESSTVHLNQAADDSPEESLATLRTFAERFGAEINDTMDDRTRATAQIGRISYKQLVWHRKSDKRDAELERLRAEVAELRAHAAPVASGAVADEADEADDAEGGFRFGQDDHLPLHYSAGGEVMGCKLTFAGLPRGHGYTTAWERVTCEACLAAKPVSAE